jgi:hypothetical protein
MYTMYRHYVPIVTMFLSSLCSYRHYVPIVTMFLSSLCSYRHYVPIVTMFLSSMYSSLCSSYMYSYYSVLKHCAHIRCTHIVCTYSIRSAHVYYVSSLCSYRHYVPIVHVLVTMFLVHVLVLSPRTDVLGYVCHEWT